MFDGVYDRFSTRKGLIESNHNIKREVLRLKSELILLEQYQEENKRLRKLLGSPFIRDEKKVVTEVMAVDTSPYRHQVVIDKGLIDGVYEGQPVINEKGIVGQVTFVAAHNSRVLLLTDANNAIPVQVIRNDIRVIASGNGMIDEIQLEHIPASTDIQEEDLLVTSGLGRVYPEDIQSLMCLRLNRILNVSSPLLKQSLWLSLISSDTCCLYGQTKISKNKRINPA